MIFTPRQLKEKCQEMQTHLETTFVDLSKAFNTVNRDGPWFALMVRQLHDGMTARVTDNGTVSEAFAVTSGVKHGCVLVLTLFILMFSAMLMDAYRDEHPGNRFLHRTDGHLLNSWGTLTPMRVSKTAVHNLLFADDCPLKTATDKDMQRSMDLFAAGCANFGLTVVMHQPPPSVEYNAVRINVSGAHLKDMENFAYLGSELSRNTRIDDEVTQRIAQTSQAFGRQQASV
ncbi:unnamed protein product [Schistocephalus solidus]|uniref:Reverse transcriptase domain-containing protein n=1 Tax=Schistocephalus solidus TaxID=70667 RepID=A0A183SQE4_SCHSO|nr:unnamed protein product [Schistocephalus solidus]